MDDILPNKKPKFWFFRFPRVGQKVTVFVGKPIIVKDTIEQLRRKNASDEEMRKTLTDLIERNLKALRTNAEIYHAKRATNLH